MLKFLLICLWSWFAEIVIIIVKTIIVIIIIIFYQHYKYLNFIFVEKYCDNEIKETRDGI